MHHHPRDTRRRAAHHGFVPTRPSRRRFCWRDRRAHFEHRPRTEGHGQRSPLGWTGARQHHGHRFVRHDPNQGVGKPSTAAIQRILVHIEMRDMHPRGARQHQLRANLLLHLACIGTRSVKVAPKGAGAVGQRAHDGRRHHRTPPRVRPLSAQHHVQADVHFGMRPQPRGCVVEGVAHDHHAHRTHGAA